MSRIPLIILSADRPDFLLNTGANQTIYQKDIYGSYVRYFSDIGLPEKNLEKLEKNLVKSLKLSMGTDIEKPPGPVHLNFPFDEPLLSEKIDYPAFSSFLPLNIVENKNDNISILQKVNKPLVIVGPMEENISQKLIVAFANQINAPLLVDPLSQMRYGFKDKVIISHYDQFVDQIGINPDLIIRFGRKPTSKKLCSLLDKWNSQTVLIDKWKKFNDDSKDFIQSDINNFCQLQIDGIDWTGERDWIYSFIDREKIVEKELNNYTEYSEGSIARICQETLKDGDNFIIGNSMPIRDVDMYTSLTNIKINTYANRGASGIDGVVSTALGVASASQKNSLLLIGDLSFYHDMNGLLSTQNKNRLTIVVINNSGGGIFSFLPIANMGINTFSKYWTTDTGISFKKVAELYNCRYSKSEGLKELKSNIIQSFQSEGTHIIELTIDISENVKLHRNFKKRINSLLKSN